ncbi:MAG: hypothetical protein IKB07_10445 [Lachnospiraceae bacterium]|nr:hypothetical protein [Lachnospiraceae bacterium]
MEKLKKISKVMNVVFKLVLIYAVVQFILCLVDLSTDQVALLMENPGGDTIKVSGFDLGRYKLDFRNEQSMRTKYLINEIITSFLAAALKLAEHVFLVCIFGKLLKPMTQGQPYDGTASKTLRTLGIGCILFCIVSNVLSYLQAKSAYSAIFEFPQMFSPEVVEGIYAGFHINLGGFFIGIMILLFSLVFRYGEELQVQVDETL